MEPKSEIRNICEMVVGGGLLYMLLASNTFVKYIKVMYVNCDSFR